MLAARRSIVTVEEVVDELVPRPNAVVLPAWVVDAVCEVPGGAHPSFAIGYSSRDNAFYRAWDDDQPGARLRSRRGSSDHVLGTSDFAEYQASLGLQPIGAATAMTVTADDVMIVNAARCLSNDVACFVGIGLPSTAANLARRLHAPDCVLVYESGCIGSKPTRLPLSIGDGELAETADAVVSVPEIFAYWLQAGGSTSASSAPRSSTASATSTPP